MDRPIRTALLSVYNKKGIRELADFLDSRGVTILATPGTAGAIRVRPYSVVSMGYVVDGESLYYTINEGREERFGFGEEITNIDLVVVNEEPLEFWTRRPSRELQELGTMYLPRKPDLGGNALIAEVSVKYGDKATVLTDPSSYELVMEEITRYGHILSDTAARLNSNASLPSIVNIVKVARNGITPLVRADLEAKIGKPKRIIN